MSHPKPQDPEAAPSSRERAPLFAPGPRSTLSRSRPEPSRLAVFPLAEPGGERRSRRARWLQRLGSGLGLRLETLLVVLGLVAAIALSPRLRGLERHVLVELTALGSLAPLFLVQGYAVASLLVLPVFPLDLAAGAHFGWLQGVLWVQAAATLGSMVGYLFGRSALRRPVDRLLQRRPAFRRIQQAVEREGWKVVFLTRLSPVFSFTFLNVVYGSARVPFLPYLLATFLGILPGTVLYVFAGSMAGDLSGAPGHAELLASHWIPKVLGLLLTAVVVVAVTRRASRLLRASMESEGAEASA